MDLLLMIFTTYVLISFNSWHCLKNPIKHLNAEVSSSVNTAQ
jgi:hypothetical protein